jgi:uncharacterized tellurite resistance protein B-like protein
MTDKNETIADLLMGAAYADNHLDGRELDAVKKLLANVMSLEQLPEEMTARLESFDAKGFDARAAAQSLELTTEEEKRNLVELIAAVTEADDELDLDENDYIEEVAGALDLPRATFTDLTVEVLSVENLQAAGQRLMSVPPPIPEKARK